MLRKLLKHEFRATGRIMLPLFAVLLAASVGANFSIQGMLDSENRILSILGVLLIAGFLIAMAAVCLMSFALMVQRFYKNLLQDEGYLMMTLPVSIHQHVWCKLIVSAVWFAATFAVVILACGILVMNIEFVHELWQGLRLVCSALISQIRPGTAANAAALCMEFLAACIVGVFALCLRFYSAMSIGFSCSSHKMPASIAVFLATGFVLNLVGGSCLVLLNDSWFHQLLLGWTPWVSETAAVHLSAWFLILCEMIYAAVFYFVTVCFLQKHLNLE